MTQISMDIAPRTLTGDAPAARTQGRILRKALRGMATVMSLAVSCWVATTVAANAQLPSIGGDLTPYLVGEFDFIRPLADNSVSAMEHRYTVHNPTASNLRFLAAPFDSSGAPSNIAGLTCWSGDLPPNGGQFLAIAAVHGFPTVNFGTVKIVAIDRLGRPAAGIVGFQERFMYTGDGPLGGKDVVAGSRSNLASVPVEALRDGELEKILKACNFNKAPGDITTGAQAESDDPRVRIRTSGDSIIHRAR